MSKDTVVIPDNLFHDVNRYLDLNARIKQMEAELDALKKQYKAALKPFFDPTVKYESTFLEFTARKSYEVNQISAVEALRQIDPRDVAFNVPKYLQIKSGTATKDSRFAEVMQDLAVVTYSDPVITVRKVAVSKAA